MNRYTVFLTAVMLAILMILSISGVADKPKQQTAKSPAEEKITSKVISSEENQNNQTEVIEQSQDISDKEPIISGQDQKSAPDNLTSPARAGEQINWQVISGGGTDGSSTNYNLLGTVGQTATGEGSATSYGLIHGYWQAMSTGGPCDCEPGEADGIPLINILDIVYIINFKYKDGPDPVPYALCSADAIADCVINILDIVHVINYKYKGGPAPVTCEEWTLECGSLH